MSLEFKSLITSNMEVFISFTCVYHNDDMNVVLAVSKQMVTRNVNVYFLLTVENN